MHRREALGYLAAAGLGAGTFRAVDNVVLGYGVITGTNLREQDLHPYVADQLRGRETTFDAPHGTVSIRSDGRAVIVDDGTKTTLEVDETATDTAAAHDDALGTDGLVSTLLADLRDIEREAFEVEPMDHQSFFETVRSVDARAPTVEAVRTHRTTGADPDAVESFTGVSPTEPEATVQGLVGGFREHSYYDVPRYTAGSVEDNVLAGRVDLRRHFEEPTDFQSLIEGDGTGLFCTELTYGSLDALHAVPAPEQRAPVFAGYVQDSRHKHAYTAIASLYRDDGELVVPIAFVDYTYSTLYDDLRLTRLLGEGLEAYDARHRVTRLYWAA